MCAPRPPGVVGRSPASMALETPPRALARNSEHRVSPGSVCLSQAGVWAALLSPQRARSKEAARGARDPRPGRSFPGPRTSGGARPRTPARAPYRSCRDCAGCSARAACARTAWLGAPSPARPRRGGRDAGRADLQATCQQRCSPRGPPALRFYGRLGGRGR